MKSTSVSFFIVSLLLLLFATVPLVPEASNVTETSSPINESVIKTTTIDDVNIVVEPFPADEDEDEPKSTGKSVHEPVLEAITECPPAKDTKKEAKGFLARKWPLLLLMGAIFLSVLCSSFSSSCSCCDCKKEKKDWKRERNERRKNERTPVYGSSGNGLNAKGSKTQVEPEKANEENSAKSHKSRKSTKSLKSRLAKSLKSTKSNKSTKSPKNNSTKSSRNK
ncbi:unnamed protein product [Bursaphelenchus okinawaensis]|uniref:Uncharacterized protein n=1 Tax=Bursaphelenchus okinawaensis TaxID=465554 RepID=A0A811JWL3_9BILA|nr:unnamed protein product [Bursaphelenchus okinawaensis]CAG9086474.1 unnamed protein product [Bursaphelenchus okinawaensis]